MPDNNTNIPSKHDPSIITKKINLPESEIDRGPITLAEIQQATKERIYEISREFTQGFKFLEQYPKSVTIFGSTKFTEGNVYYDSARQLAKKIVKDLNYSVITGGGPGIMEGANKGAKESGGNSIGLTIRLPKEQVMNYYLTNHIDFYYFFARKVCLAYSAEAFVFFPGGFGTFDEFSELITLHQPHKVPEVPIILIGSDYWREVENFFRETMFKRGTIDEEDFKYFRITDDLDEVISIIENSPVHERLPYEGLKVNPIDPDGNLEDLIKDE